jgi:PPOX class probable F420-dependent enzyme
MKTIKAFVKSHPLVSYFLPDNAQEAGGLRKCSTQRIKRKRELEHRREEVKEMAVKQMRNLTPTPTVGKGEKMSTLTTTTTSRAVEAFRGLKGYRFLNLTTFRKNGAPVVTTVLFALADDKIYMWTAKDSGKVKRIRNNAAVQIAPSTRLGRPLGPIATASARILSVTEQTEAQIVTDRQFGWLKKYFALIWRLQGREQIYLEITPTEE